jgi:hypothetical protein
MHTRPHARASGRELEAYQDRVHSTSICWKREHALDVNLLGWPEHRSSHLQRRLILIQRARRKADNFVTPLPTRPPYSRGR